MSDTQAAPLAGISNPALSDFTPKRARLPVVWPSWSPLLLSDSAVVFVFAIRDTYRSGHQNVGIADPPCRQNLDRPSLALVRVADVYVLAYDRATTVALAARFAILSAGFRVIARIAAALGEHNMQKANEFEIAQAFSQFGQVALWLDADWQPPQSVDDQRLIASKDWVGVWSDSGDPTMADLMDHLWSEENRPRRLIQVPNTLAEALGDSFRFSDYAPYMFLKGRADKEEMLDEIAREDSRIDKIRQLARIENGVLLIAGSSDPRQAMLAAAQAGRRADQLRRIVIIGIQPAECEQEFGRFREKYTALASKLAVSPDSLGILIQRIQELAITRERRAVRIGGKEVLLGPLLRQEPPITQDYAVLTTTDIAPVTLPDENESQLLVDLLAGKVCPWRSVARSLVWDGRPEFASLRSELSNAIESIRRADKKVVVINMEVEAGAGTTVLLSQLAVFAAAQYCPTLFHLAAEVTPSYPRLRTFLTDLYRDIGGSDAVVPAVIFYDVDSSWADVYGYLELLPSRLSRDGRRAVIIRARQPGGPWASSQKHPKSPRDVSEKRIERPLREQLGEREAIALAGWLERQYRRLIGESLPAGWFDRLRALSSDAGCPLLVAISVMLADQYREVARLGDRLIARLERVVSVVEAERNPPARLLDDESPGGIMAGLRRALQIGTPATVGRDQFYSLAVVLAAMGCLRVSIPRRVLAHLAGVDAAEIITTIALLERAGLAVTREADLPGLTVYGDGTAYRTKAATVQLAHHEYGRLLLESLVGNCDLRGVAAELLAVAAGAIQNNRLGLTCVELLRPILAAMRPGEQDDREFAEQLVQRFLRVQREKRLAGRDEAPFVTEEQSYRRYQWEQREAIRDAFSWIPEELIQTSASILHSRAITRAKSTFNERPEEARQLYAGAENDLVSALEMDENNRSDNPAHMLCTLGMVYVHWAHLEREHGDPGNRIQMLDQLADDTLREARSLQLDSAYPAYQLALHKVDTAAALLGSAAEGDQERAAVNIAEALELLSTDPEPGFRAEWEELSRRAVGLLEAETGAAVIAQLKSQHKMLGWGLEALQQLNGDFPRQRDVEIKEEWLASAWAILEDGFSDVRVTPTPIAQLLRYAVFSAREERETRPEYETRLVYLRPLVNTRYFEDEPIWKFDYGMLCYQNGDYEEGAKVFRDLRRSQRFFYISNDRSVRLTDASNSLRPREFQMQVQSIDSRTGQGWARIALPRPFPDPVPFGVRAFVSRDIPITVRATRPCHITIRPAGPYAEPPIER